MTAKPPDLLLTARIELDGVDIGNRIVLSMSAETFVRELKHDMLLESFMLAVRDELLEAAFGPMNATPDIIDLRAKADAFRDWMIRRMERP